MQACIHPGDNRVEAEAEVLMELYISGTPSVVVSITVIRANFGSVCSAPPKSGVPVGRDLAFFLVVPLPYQAGLLRFGTHVPVPITRR